MFLFRIFPIICTYLLLYNNLIAKDLTLEDIYLKGVFQPSLVLGDIRSMHDGENYAQLIGYSKIEKIDFETGTIKELLFDIKKYKSFENNFIYDFSFNSDDSRILITIDINFIYRHSYTADYIIYDIKSDSIYPLSEIGYQQLATFSPDGSKIAFVRENNIFIKNLITHEEKQITFDGKINNIINGKPDWVYEEEFSFSQGFFWSPNSNKIVYYKFDESHVKQFNMTMYEDIYPSWYKYKYPKAGEKNSIVSVHVYDLNSEQTTNMDVGDKTDQYIPRIEWTESSRLICITRLNRLQNQFDILISNVETGKSSMIYSETSSTFISEINDDQITFIDSTRFILKSEKSGYNHLYLYSINGKELKKITKGDWEVNSLADYDPVTETIYYESLEESPLSTQVYAITIDGKNKRKLSSLDGSNNLFFNHDFSYCINLNQSANTPYKLSINNSEGDLLRTLEDNSDIIEKSKEYKFKSKEFLKVPIGDIILNGYMIKPPDFKPDKKYPLFMFVYGGPGSRKVTDEWDMRYPWFQYLASKGYIIACVDGRGTGGRGEEFKKCIYKQLGKLETEDQINAAKYFGGLSYIDETRIGIFGWSYGGYLTTLCLTKGANVFKMGVAVAMVANWKFYDTIYTERYLGLPNDNKEGYDENSPVFFADGLEGKLLLIHGTADDNVHVQHIYEYANALVKAGKQFDMHVYPNKNHGIYGSVTQYHLYTKITEYILNNL